jgi:hypothetical protein
VPIRVQDRTQQMLRELLARDPVSKNECVAGVDDVIRYLERNVAMSVEFRGMSSSFEELTEGKPLLS